MSTPYTVMYSKTVYSLSQTDTSFVLWHAASLFFPLSYGNLSLSLSSSASEISVLLCLLSVLTVGFSLLDALELIICNRYF